MPWKFRPLDPIERENDALKATIVCLRRELENKQGAVGRLKILVQQRSNTIDDLRGKLEQSQQQIRQLNEEAEHYYRMLAAGFDARDSATEKTVLGAPGRTQ